MADSSINVSIRRNIPCMQYEVNDVSTSENRTILHKNAKNSIKVGGTLNPCRNPVVLLDLDFLTVLG